MDGNSRSKNALRYQRRHQRDRAVTKKERVYEIILLCAYKADFGLCAAWRAVVFARVELFLSQRVALYGFALCSNAALGHPSFRKVARLAGKAT